MIADTRCSNCCAENVSSSLSSYIIQRIYDFPQNVQIFCKLEQFNKKQGLRQIVS